MTVMSVPIFHSDCDRDSGAAEKLLTDAGIDYTLRLEPVTRTNGVCYQGLLFEVDDANAERAKRLLAEHGLALQAG